MFGKIHLVNTDDGYGVKDVYCQRLTTKDDYQSRPPGPGQIPDVEVMNTEHTWPQSHFSSQFSKDMQKSDLHILYPVLTDANSSRGNLKFGSVTNTVDQPCEESKRGYISNGGSELYFEPADQHKGNAARAVFYFAVRYKLPISEEEEASLRAWNAMDPVDEFERTRNDLIFDAQKERNPFIDHPELADLISDF
jgi:endonuclease I